MWLRQILDNDRKAASLSAVADSTARDLERSFGFYAGEDPG